MGYIYKPNYENSNSPHYMKYEKARELMASSGITSNHIREFFNLPSVKEYLKKDDFRAIFDEWHRFEDSSGFKLDVMVLVHFLHTLDISPFENWTYSDLKNAMEFGALIQKYFEEI